MSLVFEQRDFSVFDDQTVAGRMAGIKNKLDPKFEVLGQELAEQLTKQKMVTYVQVAKHLRRHVYPAPNTWFALGPHKRGYKMLPHIEIGFWDDRLFVWLCLLENIQDNDRYEMVIKQQCHAILALAKKDKTWRLSGNHMAKPTADLTQTDLQAQTRRFATVKKGEWLLGKIWPKNDPIFDQPGAVEAEIKQTVSALVPLYQDLLMVL
ncbi:hypothetical protein AYR54_05585 [Loigolactobacillus backii]|uniref:Uncharacterized protein n=1 Tax=Loigolactobacillus backii TaxID=375175 RepID=A0A192H4N0_9LACO|nr:hypothetical protein AYR52_05565 [Loigolactobacillus backii]ANK63172.1 hypothetical protein AYR53_10585 [Loigolactobacillus backii]ANK64766.1 hypothetical protein AYR54_05585 [Loigolactobacillus backii]ANK66785.1 hypothetical protein AYR55_03160 [Loigolactobacillus backii]ANK69822.1 hypothetical protein AYR56_06420 [Loigolactobacillus backii]